MSKLRIQSVRLNDNQGTEAAWPDMYECTWDVQLTDAEVGLLATGHNPLHIRPSRIVKYVNHWKVSGRQVFRANSDEDDGA